MTEAVLPFVIVIIWVIYVILLGFLKIMNSHTLLYSSLIWFDSLLLLFIWIIVAIYLLKEGFILIGLLVIAVIVISYIINAVWCLAYYQPFVIKKDAFYYQWMKIYPKTKILIQILSYSVSFHMFRLSLCRFLSLGIFSAALYKDRVISRVMNIFSIVYICTVC